MDTRLTILGTRPSYLNHLLYEMRDVTRQQDRMRFRMNLERTGEILAYEISRHLPYQPQPVTTPLGSLDIDLLDQQPVIISIMRAGLPLHQGFLRIFDQADNGFIAAYRHHTQGNEFIIKVEYMALPDITDRDLILVDPMIATGKSLVLSYQHLLDLGKPRRILIAGVIGSEEGVQYVLRNIPQAHIWVAALDHELTARSYIVPGLGDAGDLAFGPK
ncbi:MAG: uracil phosphoribosyltransferase [Bacteroidia bacterium]|nr:uracil phosphoribosyltransferase [Bacteroidia bacterium]